MNLGVRRWFFRRVGLSLVWLTAAVASAQAQTIQNRQTPYVITVWTTAELTAAPYIREIEAEFRRFGYRPGQNIRLEHRYTDGKPERLAGVAREIVASKPDVVMAGLNTSAVAIRALTTTIPIVVGNSIDPVGAGLASSISRPGGNVTGLMSAPPETMAKRLQLLKQVAPETRRIGVIWNEGNPGIRVHLEVLVKTAPSYGVALVLAPMKGPDDLDGAFETLRQHGVDGVMGLTTDNLTFLLRRQVAARALQARIPSVFGERQFCQEGVLLCYSADLSALFPKSVKFVDRILKGESPGNLPFEYPTSYELAINQTTAGMLGLRFSTEFEARADFVFE